jgi:hypothetical protein
MPMGLGQGWRNARSGSYRSAWVFLAAATVCGTAGLVINAAAGNPSKLSKHTVLELGGLVLVLWAVAAVLLLFAISRFNRIRHAVERDRKQDSARQLAAEHVTLAGRLAGQLVAGEAPVLGQVWDVVLQPGERVLLDGSVGYSRYYGLGSPAAYTNVSTRHSGNVGSGQALLDHKVGRVGNRRRPQAAGVAAAARWRDQQQSRVVVTDRRLLCQVHAKGWVSFDHATATAIQALSETRGVVLEYPDTAPVRLSGPVTAQLMVIVVWALYGADGLRKHPALSEVRSVGAFPVVSGAAPPELLDTEVPKVSASAPNDVNAEEPPVGDGPAADNSPVDLLAFVAVHELVLAEHAALLLGVSEADAAARLEELCEQGLVSHVRLSTRSPAAYRITQHGADQVDTALPPLRPMDLTGYRSAVALPGLWFAARSGMFGETRDVLTARQMHAADASSRTGSLLEGPGARFRNEPPEGEADAGLGYPDLGLLGLTGGWASADLMLAVGDPERLRTLIGRGNHDSLVVERLFLVDHKQSGELIQATAAELGLADRVRIQLIEPAGIASA